MTFMLVSMLWATKLNVWMPHFQKVPSNSTKYVAALKNFNRFGVSIGLTK